MFQRNTPLEYLGDNGNQFCKVSCLLTYEQIIFTCQKPKAACDPGNKCFRVKDPKKYSGASNQYADCPLEPVAVIINVRVSDSSRCSWDYLPDNVCANAPAPIPAPKAKGLCNCGSPETAPPDGDGGLY